jgi:hypothetical protein
VETLVAAGLGDVMRHEISLFCRLRTEALRTTREDNSRVEKRMQQPGLVWTTDVMRQSPVAFGSRN